jgi:fucose permease
MATRTGNWKLVFLVYAVTSFLAVIWLYFTRIEESKPDRKPATFKTCLSLLANPFILLMVIAIFLVVGADVGMNSNIANYLQKTFNLTLEDASIGISVYFTALMIGRLLGAVILNWLPARRFLVITVLLVLAAFIGMIISPDVWMARVFIFLAGLGAANTFPLIFSITLEKMPGRSNEISGLMIMAVSGGAVIPPVMGLISASAGAIASLFVLVACMGYVLMAAFYSLKR